jgi:membrane protease YdiL (CAAX protease family)
MMNKTTLSDSERTGGPRSIKRLAGLLDIVAAYVPLFVIGIIGTRLGAGTLLGGMLINLGYVLSIIVASGMLKLRGTAWREIGLARPQSWLRTVLLSIGAMVGAVVVMNVAVTIMARNLPGAELAEADVSRFNPLEGNVPLLLLYLVLSWTTITFGEEMFYRAFLTDRLAKVFQDTKLGWALAAVGSSVAFGLAHYQEGPLGIVSNGAFGLLFAAIYLWTGRNLWVTVIAHGLLNTLRFVLVFSGAA